MRPVSPPGRRCAALMGFVALAAALGAPVHLAQAAPRLVFAGEAERVYSIERRPHLFSHELTLGGGVAPLNSFYVGLAPSLSYTYHFSDMWAWELVGGFYSFNKKTNLDALIASTGQVAVLGADYRLRTIVSSNVQLRPFYGKMALFNHGIVNAQVYFVAGAGMALANVENAVAGTLGIGLMFWASDAIGIKLDVRDSYVFGKSYPNSVLMITLAASFNFNVVKGPAWRPHREFL